MSRYRFFVSTNLERKILNYAKEIEEPVHLPSDLESKLKEFSNQVKVREITLIDCLEDEEVWYTVYRDGDKFICYELTDDLLRRTDYGMA